MAGVDRNVERTWLRGVSEAPDSHELVRQVAVLEERMNATQAEVKASLEAGNASFERLRAEMADRDAARSERDATARWWQTTIIIGAVAIALGVAGLMFG